MQQWVWGKMGTAAKRQLGFPRKPFLEAWQTKHGNGEHRTRGGLVANLKTARNSMFACVYEGANKKKGTRATKVQLIKINV